MAIISLLFTLSTTCSYASERAALGWQKIQQGAVVIDVRTAEEFADGHLDNAINFPLSELSHHVSNLDKTTPIVLYCRSGNRSGQAYQHLTSLGFTQLHNAGGLQEIKMEIAK
ncbi:rhodanese-like domain-containing protein [Vibrio sp. S4B1]|nr:rhodanese-like domain-containing protein [Vibrio methylphosphonaticus]MCL9776676.1 rhodanese-like domain-containing protein [Vibrio methylphosphonaticus]